MFFGQPGVARGKERRGGPRTSLLQALALTAGDAIFREHMIDQQDITAMAERREDGGDEDGTGLGIATRTRAKTKQPTPF